MILLSSFFNNQEWLAIGIAATFVLLYAVMFSLRLSSKVIGNSHQNFDNFNYDVEELYKTIEKCIAARDIPDIEFSRTHFARTLNVLGGWNAYLRVDWKEYRYEIGAGPFGRGYFVSCWTIERISHIRAFMRRHPKLMMIADLQTYHQIDTRNVFKAFINSAIEEALAEITSQKGVRLSNEDMKAVKREALPVE